MYLFFECSRPDWIFAKLRRFLITRYNDNMRIGKRLASELVSLLLLFTSSGASASETRCASQNACPCCRIAKQNHKHAIRVVREQIGLIRCAPSEGLSTTPHDTSAPWQFAFPCETEPCQTTPKTSVQSGEERLRFDDGQPLPQVSVHASLFSLFRFRQMQKDWQISAGVGVLPSLNLRV